MILLWIKKLWEVLNIISPETRSLLIILLFGYVLYSLITETTKEYIGERFQEEVLHNKKAEQYSMETSVELNRLVLLIAEEDNEAFDVLLLNYHNNTQSLLGYKYLYLSCLTEAPKSLDTPLLKLYWNKIDYIYYADELARIHSQSFILIKNIEEMGTALPKLYRLVRACDALAVSFYTIEGNESAIGMIVILYKDPRSTEFKCNKAIFSAIQKLALFLDYENLKK